MCMWCVTPATARFASFTEMLPIIIIVVLVYFSTCFKIVLRMQKYARVISQVRSL